MPKIKLATIVILLLAGGLSGCASAPAEFVGIQLIPVSSASVAIHRPHIRERNGQPMLDGYVYKQFNAQTTEQTHLDIVFLDDGGNNLRTEQTHFTPQKINWKQRGHRDAHYSLSLSNMPKGTTRIEVQAHDSPRHL